MTLSKSCLLLLTLLGVSLSGSPARADVAPPDQCSASEEGKPCDNAMGTGNDLGAGVCKATTCQRATPSGSMTYDCYRCVANEGGSGGSSGGSSSTAGTSSGGKSGGDGCSVATVGAAGGVGGLLLALGFLSARAARRRSSRG